MLRYVRIAVLFSVLIPLAPAVQALEISSGFTVNLELKKTTYHLNEPLDGKVVIRSTKSGYPVNFDIKVFHEDELRYSKVVHLPQVFMGTETYSLETFGLNGGYKEAGPWRLEIGQVNGPDQTIVDFKVVED